MPKFLAQLVNIASMESLTLVYQVISAWEVHMYPIQQMEHLDNLVIKVITAWQELLHKRHAQLELIIQIKVLQHQLVA